MAPKNIKLSKRQHHLTDALKISKQQPNAYVEEHCIYKGGKKDKCDLLVLDEKGAKKKWHIQYNIINGERHNFHMSDNPKQDPKKSSKTDIHSSPSELVKAPKGVEAVQHNIENYFNCPCAHNVEGRQTGHPLTSHETKKFNNSVTSRSDYDQYWLKVYNTYTDNINYNLA